MMKKNRFLAPTIAILLIFSFFVKSKLVFSLDKLPTMTEKQKIEIIENNCEVVTEKLKSIQKLDSRVRVFLGKNYEQVLNNYIIPLNLALVKNSLNGGKSVDLQEKLVKERENFNKLFIDYSQELEDLVINGCNNKKGFLDKLKSVKIKRARLSEKVNEINGRLIEYYNAVKSIKVGKQNGKK